MYTKLKLKNKIIRFWKLLGPGLVTGASDDDPSGIATYSQAGAAYGLATLWTAPIAFPLMAAIQQMCARIGLVTSHGLTGALKNNYPRPVLYLVPILPEWERWEICCFHLLTPLILAFCLRLYFWD
jgi:Mn2+/Fe2+ NRAMP family transporter